MKRSILHCVWICAFLFFCSVTSSEDLVRKSGSSVRVSVDATQEWTATEVNVSKGDFLWFAVNPEDRIQCSSRYRSNADGTNLPTSPSMLVPDGQTCALIGRIGESAPFLIGMREAPFVADESGLLSLGINDYRFQDNAGDFDVVVKRSSDPSDTGLTRILVDVIAVQAWTRTNLSVQTGQNLYFFVSPEDEINCDRRPTSTNAAGIANDIPETTRIIPDAPECALLGKVASTAPFLIGLSHEPFPAPATGSLMLGINDDDHYDNSGEFKVFIVED